MKLPEDKPLYADMRTAFVRFAQLLSDLESREFSGYVRVKGHHMSGTVFFADGELRGSDAPIDKIVRTAAESGGTVGVYVAPADLMTLVASLAHPEVLHKDLSSEFVDAMKLLEKLARDGHSGYVEFEIAGGEAHGYLFLIGGEPVEAVYASPARSGSGLGMVPVILDDVDARGAAMSVYRADAPEEDEAPAPLPVAPEYSIAPQAPGADDGGEAAATVDALDHVVNVAESHADSAALQELAAMWGAILGSVESIVDDAAEPGAFVKGFREVLEERAKDFAFLDPDDGFTYGDGVVEFVMTPPSEFSREVGECLSDSIARISFRLRKVDLESTIQRQLERVVGEYADTLERFGMSRAASSFLAA